jgi:hypothetical protein
MDNGNSDYIFVQRGLVEVRESGRAGPACFSTLWLVVAIGDSWHVVATPINPPYFGDGNI